MLILLNTKFSVNSTPCFEPNFYPAKGSG